MTEYKISLMPGDGIGPELTEATLKVLDVAQQKFGIKLLMIPRRRRRRSPQKHAAQPYQRTAYKPSKTPRLA